MSEWKNIVIHISDSEFGCIRLYRKWHTLPPPKGRGWRDVAYHFGIMNGFPVKDFYLESLDGMIECGRQLDGDAFVEADEVGAHALGMNRDSIGIVLAGKDESNLTTNQFSSLGRLCVNLGRRFEIPVENWFGHYETPNAGGKTCPNYDVRGWREVMKYDIQRGIYGNP